LSFPVVLLPLITTNWKLSQARKRSIFSGFADIGEKQRLPIIFFLTFPANLVIFKVHNIAFLKKHIFRKKNVHTAN
jgi:hypothetical protein